MSDRFLVLLIAQPFVFSIAALEGYLLTRWARERYNWKAYFTSMGDVALRNLGAVFLKFGLAAPVLAFAWQHRFYTMPMNAAWAFVILFFAQEFCYYWQHRGMHRIRWFWNSHSVHHSPNELNLSVAYRMGWIGKHTGAAVFYVPAVLMGFRPDIVLLVAAVNLFFQFWLHNTWMPKLGWIEWVLNTPSHHRVHHASNKEYLDVNFGGTLIIFDRMFGTFVEEKADVPCEYGLVKKLHSYNPIYVNFHEWKLMLRDLSRARRPSDVLGYVFGPPGWRPADRAPSPTPQSAARAPAMTEPANHPADREGQLVRQGNQ